MTKEKRKMIRVLDIELFQRNRESILRFERDRVEQLGGIKPQPHLSDSRVLDIMSRTCSALWGAGQTCTWLPINERMQWLTSWLAIWLTKISLNW